VADTVIEADFYTQHLPRPWSLRARSL